MAKPDGRKKGSKGNKDGNSEARVSKPKAVKPQKPKGPKPDFTPRAMRQTEEVVQTDLNVIWNGWSGLVEHAGMQFRTTKINGEKRDYQVVHVVSAPQGTELYGLGGSSIYVTVQSLHSPKFHSTLEVGSAARSRQECIWKCLDKALREAKIKGAHVRSVPKAVEHKHESKASTSVADFDLKKKGLYRFDTSVPYAIISVEPLDNGSRAPQFGSPESNQLVIKLVSVGKGHPLSECKVGTFLYYGAGLFKGKTPAFSGSHAKDCAALYEYLAGVRSLYRQSVVDKIANPSQVPQGAVGENALVCA